jgi:predicted transcriptional regulator
MHRYPNFAKALTALAPNAKERARLLGVSERSITNYLAGRFLPPVEVVKRFPELDRALDRDIAAQIAAERQQIPA